MRCRMVCVIIALAVMLSGINYDIVRAQEVQVQEEPDVPVIEIEDLDPVVETDYSIRFENLRGEDSTWVFSDETEYRLTVDTVNLQEYDHVEFSWDVIVKESGERLTEGFQISEDNASMIINGQILKEQGFTDQTLVIKAIVCLEGIETEYSCQTEVVVKDKKVVLNAVFKDTHGLDTRWYYSKRLSVYIEDRYYPAGEDISLETKEVVSSDSAIAEASYDEIKGKWSVEAKNTGNVTLLLYLSDGNHEYTIEHPVTIVCYHKKTYDVVQVNNLLTQAKSWLGFKEADSSHMKIVNIYNAYSPLPLNYVVQKRDAWCATYVSAVAIKQGYTYLIPVECGCGRMIDRFKTRGNWREDENCTPENGWIIFYDWQDSGNGDNKGWPDHVGIVEKVSDGKITVIEGNYDDKVKRRIIDVNGRYIRGYGVPEYGKETVRATTSKKGTITEGCTQCGDVKKTTIYPATDISLSRKTFTYNGKTKELLVNVKNSKGKTISSGEYYLSGSVSKASVGKYNIKVNLDGKKYTGTKTLSYVIQPKAPSKVSAFLHGGYDDVKVTWEKCTGADGYYVYYKNGIDGTYSKLLSTTKTSCVKNNLSDGKRCYFKIVPYFLDGSKKIESANSKTANVYTLKKLQAPKLSKNSAKTVNVKWNDISGETGYQVSKTLLRGNKKVCVSTSKNELTLKVSKRINYYYRVRAYKTVNGKTVYGPWSDAVSYKLK